MPPKATPTAKQAAVAKANAAAVTKQPTNPRKPIPLPGLPPNNTVSPLWSTEKQPSELFPEWPSSLATENWYTVEAPFEDPVQIPVPSQQDPESITWKRPSRFLPVIPDPVAAAPAAGSLPPVVADPKSTAAAKKGGPPPAASKKPVEPQPVKKVAPPKHAYIYYEEPQESNASSAPDNTKPSLTSFLRRDFRRLWSVEEVEDLTRWKKEEERIEKEKEKREKVYMAYEDAIAYVLNERPRIDAEAEIDATDLVDDGEEEEEDSSSTTPAQTFPENATPYGVPLPPKIDIMPNGVRKPEIPHGLVVHGDLASYFRLIDTIAFSNQVEIAPFWQAIYPQDAQGVPMYNPGGKYSVRLFVLGKWRKIDVDDQVPLDSEGNIALLSSSMKNELWPTLIAKALFKVWYWLKSSEAKDQAVERLVVIVSALTGWKVSKWQFSLESNGEITSYESLRAYVPGLKETNNGEQDTGAQQPPTEEEEFSLDVDLSEEKKPASTLVASATTTTEESVEIPSRKPLEAFAVLLNTKLEGLGPLQYGEACLVTDIAGDGRNATFKFVSQHVGVTGLGDDVISQEKPSVLLVHRPSITSDLVISTWKKQEFTLSYPTAADASPSTGFLPYTSAQPKYLCVRNTPTEDPQDVTSANLTEVLVTLTTVPYSGATSEGRILLIQDQKLLNPNFSSSIPPVMYTVGTSSTLRLLLPKDSDHIFQVVPLSESLKLGYTLQVETTSKSCHVKLLETSQVFQRFLSGYSVVESEGSYSVLLLNTWNILFKQLIEWETPVTQEILLYIHLHLLDEPLKRLVRLSLVNNDTNQTYPLSQLSCFVRLDTILGVSTGGYTLIAECIVPTQFAVVPENKWFLTVCSGNGLTLKSPPVLSPLQFTSFEGFYKPNKSFICFRDVVFVPKKTKATSLSLELLDVETTKTLENLAVKLEIFDLATETILHTQSFYGSPVRLLQLPAYTIAEGDETEEDKSGYIIQGSIDPLTSAVPSDLKSTRPFRNYYRLPGEVDQLQSARAESFVKWKLNCWSTDELKLEPDRAQENRFDAIRAAWAEAAKDRDANGNVSRLFYTKQSKLISQEMMDKIGEATLSKYQEQYLFLDQFLQGDTQYLKILQQPVESENNNQVLLEEELIRKEEELQVELQLIQSTLQATRESRSVQKEQREHALKKQIENIKTKWEQINQQRKLLIEQRDQLRKELLARGIPSAPTTSAS